MAFHHRLAGCSRVLAGCLCALLMGMPAAFGEPNPPPLTLGIHPYLSYSQLQVRFAPLADYIAARTGRKVEVHVGRDYEEHIDEVGSDRLDIAYLGPVSYVRMTARYGQKPLLAMLERNGRTMLNGRIDVRRNSDFQSLTDLRGHVWALGDPTSTMSSVVPLASLRAAGIGPTDLAQIRHYRGHTNVAMAVLSGAADAGAVKQEVFEAFETQGLRTLTELPEVSEHLFVTRADMPAELVEQLRVILLEAREDAAGLKALRSVHSGATGLAPVHESDFDSLRALLNAGVEHVLDGKD